MPWSAQMRVSNLSQPCHECPSWMWWIAGCPTFRRRARHPGVASVPVLMLSTHCLEWGAAACSSQGQAVGWCVWFFNAYPTTTTDVQGVHSVPCFSGDTELPHPWGAHSAPWFSGRTSRLRAVSVLWCSPDCRNAKYLSISRH